MKTMKHVRFHLNELVQALECYGKLRRPSVCQALDFYYAWALARGWTYKAGFGYPVKARTLWIGGGDHANPQLEIQERDVLYEVVWSADDSTDGTCDFLEAFPVVDIVQRIIEVLEDRGWGLDPERDGYQKAGGDRISGAAIYHASLQLRTDDVDAVVESIVDGLEGSGPMPVTS